MSTSGISHSEYYSRGNTRPSKGQLLALLDKGMIDEPSPLKCDLFLDLVVADAKNAHGWLECAEEVIDELATPANLASDNQRVAAYAVAACLRRPELPAWEQAALRQSPANNYEELLDAGFEIISHVDLPISNSFIDPDDHITPMLVRYIPLLLGARQQARSQNDGWLGRLSLTREQHFNQLVHETDPNWTTGLSDPQDTSTFLDPQTKLTVKQHFRDTGNRRRSEFHKRDAYRRAGVLTIGAREGGFKDPLPVIASCVQELEGFSTESLLGDGQTPLTSDQLDELTARLAASIAQEKTIVAELSR